MTKALMTIHSICYEKEVMYGGRCVGERRSLHPWGMAAMAETCSKIANGSGMPTIFRSAFGLSGARLRSQESGFLLAKVLPQVGNGVVDFSVPG